MAVPLVLAAAGCAGGGSAQNAPAPAPAPQAVPPGVAQQYTVLEEEIKANGGEQTAGPWKIGYIVEAAEPWFEGHSGHQQHRPPQPGETHHIEIIPREAETGRIVPDVPARLEVVDAAGKVVEAKDLNFYYSTFFHYANNFSIPQPGTYTLRVSLQTPTFYRHSENPDQAPLAEGAQVTFPNVELKQEG
jgi:hypothetical protein